MRYNPLEGTDTKTGKKWKMEMKQSPVSGLYYCVVTVGSTRRVPPRAVETFCAAMEDGDRLLEEMLAGTAEESCPPADVIRKVG